MLYAIIYLFTFFSHYCLQDHFKYKCTGNIVEANSNGIHLFFNINSTGIRIQLCAVEHVSRLIFTPIVLHVKAQFLKSAFLPTLNVNSLISQKHILFGLKKQGP